MTMRPPKKWPTETTPSEGGMLSTKSNQYSTTMSGQTLVISFWLCSLLPLNLENSLSEMKARQLLHVGNVLLQMQETSLPPQNHSNSQLNFEKYLNIWIESWILMRTNYLKHIFDQEKLKVDSNCFALALQNCFHYQKKQWNFNFNVFFHLLMPVFFVFPFASQIPLTTSFQSMLVSWSPPSSAPQCLSEVVPRICRMGIQLVLFTRQLTRCSMYIYLRTCTPKTTQM